MESDTKKLTDTTKLLRECDAGTKMAISSINEILEKAKKEKYEEMLKSVLERLESIEAKIK